MDFDVGAAAPSVPDITPADPVEAPAAPAEVEAPKTAETSAPKDTFEETGTGTEDAKRIAAARDAKDGMDPNRATVRDTFLCKTYQRAKGVYEGVESGFETLKNGYETLKDGFQGLKNGYETLKDGFEGLKNGYEDLRNGFQGMPKLPIFYQGPGAWTTTPDGDRVPRESTHVGITEDAGMAAGGINRNFVKYAASANANVDAEEYDKNPAHAYEFSKEGTLKRAAELGDKMEQWTSKYDAADTHVDRQLAARGMATTYGQYLHMLQDNWAHGGTDSAEHYGARVDENPDSIKAARVDTKAAWTDLRSYFDSRGITPMAINPGRAPAYGLPPASAIKEACDSPPWNGKSLMWPRDEMSRNIQDTFNSRLRMGTNSVIQ